MSKAQTCCNRVYIGIYWQEIIFYVQMRRSCGSQILAHRSDRLSHRFAISAGNIWKGAQCTPNHTTESISDLNHLGYEGKPTAFHTCPYSITVVNPRSLHFFSVHLVPNYQLASCLCQKSSWINQLGSSKIHTHYRSAFSNDYHDTLSIERLLRVCLLVQTSEFVSSIRSIRFYVEIHKVVLFCSVFIFCFRKNFLSETAYSFWLLYMHIYLSIYLSLLLWYVPIFQGRGAFPHTLKSITFRKLSLPS